MKKANQTVTASHIQDIAFAFQEAVCTALQHKALKAATLYNAPSIALVGGVSANKRLRQ
jgi:tRNA A37 threonylcarbamoyltransferase TsaD